jgi:hypothetical protein
MVNTDHGGAFASMNAIIASLPEVIPNAYEIPSDGCEGIQYHLHFSAKGYRELGKRYGDQMLSLLKDQKESS